MTNCDFPDYCPDEKPVAGAFESDPDDEDGKGEAPLAGVEDEDDGDPKGFVAAAPGFVGVAPDAPGFLASPGL